MTTKRIQGITFIDLLMLISLFTVLTVMVVLLTQASFGEKGSDIASKADEMISKGESATDNVDFILGEPTPITLSVNSQTMELGIHFSTEQGCIDTVLHLALRGSEKHQIKSVYFENTSFKPESTFSLNGEVIKQIESVCLGSLSANESVTFDIVKKA